ncbi:MAG: TlpA disulfide reductase family protein [Verrucomicrobiota bacterium]
MIRFLIHVGAICAIAAGAVGQVSLEGTLQWANGDELVGKLTDGGENALVWTAEQLFAEPLQLEFSALESIEFDNPKDRVSDGRFRATLASGDILHGDLESIDADHVVFKSDRHGEIRIKRDEIINLRRIDHPSLIFAGPNGLSDWQSFNRRYPVDLWKGKPGGGLETKRWRAELFRQLSFPEKMETEVILQSSKRPEFTLAFDKKIGDALRIETWDDALVIVKDTTFERLMVLDDETKKIHLRLFWDRVAETLNVFSGDGELLSKMKVPALVKDGTPGVYLRNKAIDLELTKLRVGRWNGNEPIPVREDEPRIRTTAGEFVYGKISTANRDGVANLESGEAIDVAEIDTIHFRTDSPAAAVNSGLKVVYADGALVSGVLDSIDERGFAKIRTGYSDGLVKAQLQGARRMEFAVDEDARPPEPTDELQMEDKVLHGTIAGSPDAKSPIRWRPYGGVNAAPIRPDARARMVRVKTEAVSDLEGDRVFLNTREILSCRVEAIDDEHIHFKSSMTEIQQLPVERVRAIEFREGRLELVGFGDSGWKKVQLDGGKTTREPNRVILHNSGLTHHSILRADEIAFNVRWEKPEQGGLTIGLFGRGAISHNPEPLNISLSCWTNRLWVAAAEPGMANVMGGQDTNINNGEAEIRVRIDGERVRVWVNEKQLANLTHDPSKRLGNGLSFKVGGPWFDGENDLSKVVITDFEVRSTTGLLAPLRVDQDAKGQALTVPRFRLENPATHVLIAPNGDMLRGQLKAATTDLIQFESQLEKFEFARNRVSGMIALNAGELEPGLTKDERRIVLSDGSAIRLTPKSMTEDALVGRSPSLGDCELPASAIRQVHIGDFEPIADHLIYANWAQSNAKFPEIPEADGGQEEPESELVGQAAPDVVANMLGGGKFDLDKERGKVVVLDFWATWCGPCVRAFPEYIEAIEAIDSDEVRFIAVNQGEPAAVIEPFLTRHQWDFEVALDPQQGLAPKYGVEGIPHTVIVDRNGKIAWVHSGFRPGIGDTLKEKVLQLLEVEAEKPKPAASGDFEDF